ncbi:membrane protein insertase YidC [Arenimonas sp.]|uniref:membrane protein insertase YidC n=1 Tax=Arenimonas sp. TaxID=1872635 RepID=UPI0039E5E392
MNQTRSFLLIAWLFVAALLWMEWGKTLQPAAPTTTDTAAANAGTAPLPASNVAPAPLPGVAAPAGVEAAADPIVIENDVLRLTIDLAGGRLTSSQLLQYRVEKHDDSPNVSLLSSQPTLYFTADAGLIRVAGQQQQVLAERFTVEGDTREFKLADGAAAISVPLTWIEAGTGLTVRRTLTLERGSYVLKLDETMANGGTAPQQLYPYVSLDRVAPPSPPTHAFMSNPETFSFVGAAWFSPQNGYEKAPLSDFTDELPPACAAGDKPESCQVVGGWIAMLQHHFVTAWVPATNEQQLFQTSTKSHDGVALYEIRSVAAPVALAPGASASRSSQLWVGPKLQAPMQKLSPTLKRSVDYGKLTFISEPLFWLLAKLHALLGNWGWAIIAIVVLLKLLLYPLSAAQYKNMAKMRAIQPRLEALKERYGDDRQKFAMAQMELFQKEKINPIGGCLPMLIPIPIFLGLYWVLLETVELRHAPWIGWIQNLTAADPWFVLPVLNLAVMYLTQKLTPMPGMDPMQKKMMQFMPLVFGVMMAFFPSGLVLYWLTNGALGLLQQWWMTRRHGDGKTVAAR